VLQLEKIFNLEVGIALELSPIFVASDQRYFFDWKSRLEQAARSLMTKIVEVQVFDLEFIACPGECRAYGPVVMGKEPSIPSSHNPLLKHDLPRIIAG
jgi:hypothetical protein